MVKKQFQTESKKLLDMMVHSIYTNKEIFLRELISNAGDAVDKEQRTLTISDNGCGMSAEELETNLGTIAKSGSYDFKNDPEKEGMEQIDIIGQFGVGFYSAFMVADKITVESRMYGTEEGNRWESDGADGYTREPCEKTTAGTTSTLH